MFTLRLLKGAASCLVLAAGLVFAAGVSRAQELRAWTVQDSISLTYFSRDVNQTDAWPDPHASGEVNYCADGSYFFVVTHSGDLSSDSTLYTLYLFDVAAVRHQLETG